MFIPAKHLMMEKRNNMFADVNDIYFQKCFNLRSKRHPQLNDNITNYSNIFKTNYNKENKKTYNMMINKGNMKTVVLRKSSIPLIHDGQLSMVRPMTSIISKPSSHNKFLSIKKITVIIKL